MIGPLDTVAVHMHELCRSFRRAGFGRVSSLVLTVQALPHVLSGAIESVWDTVSEIGVDDVPPEWGDE